MRYDAAMMPWYDDQNLLETLKAKIDESEWAEWQAASTFRKIDKHLPKELRDRTRIGALLIEAIEGTEGLSCWMTPVEGYKKLLAPESTVRMLDAQGKILFEGKWKETTAAHVLENPNLFVWLAPKSGRAEAKLPFYLRIKGMFRLLRNAKPRRSL